MTWPQLRRVDIFQRKLLRRVARIFYPQRIKIERLYEHCRTTPWSYIIVRQRWTLTGHVLRLPAHSPAISSMSLYFKEPYSKKRGGQVNTIAQALHKDLHLSVATVSSLSAYRDFAALRQLAQDRSRWRSEIVDKVVSAYQSYVVETRNKQRERQYARLLAQRVNHDMNAVMALVDTLEGHAEWFQVISPERQAEQQQQQQGEDGGLISGEINDQEALGDDFNPLFDAHGEDDLALSSLLTVSPYTAGGIKRRNDAIDKGDDMNGADEQDEDLVIVESTEVSGNQQNSEALDAGPSSSDSANANVGQGGNRTRGILRVGTGGKQTRNGKRVRWEPKPTTVEAVPEGSIELNAEDQRSTEDNRKRARDLEEGNHEDQRGSWFGFLTGRKRQRVARGGRHNTLPTILAYYVILIFMILHMYCSILLKK